MAALYHIGASVGAIINLPMETGGYKHGDAVFDAFSTKLKTSLPYKYLLAITANCCQSRAGEILGENGFKSHVTFMSAHDSDNETLTIWVKAQKKKPALETKVTYPGWNCSVTFNRSLRYRCNLTAKLHANDILPPGFVQIPKTPIYYKIAEGKIVGLTLKNKKGKVFKPVSIFK
jgi:hypothetical protein